MIELFTSKNCPACVNLKRHLASEGTPYKEYDVGTKTGLAEFLIKGCGTSVPLVIKNGEDITSDYEDIM